MDPTSWEGVPGFIYSSLKEVDHFWDPCFTTSQQENMLKRGQKGVITSWDGVRGSMMIMIIMIIMMIMIMIMIILDTCCDPCCTKCTFVHFVFYRSCQ